MTVLRLASGEVHLPSRQMLLKLKAFHRATLLSGDPNVLGVLLSGSIARGPVGLSSDLDLHAITSAFVSNGIRSWRFTADGTIENIHQVEVATLLRGVSLKADSDALTRWFHKTRLGDELCGHEALYWDIKVLPLEHFSSLLSRRNEPEIAAKLSVLYGQAAFKHVSSAQDAVLDGAIADAHQQLRLSVQLALIAILIARGWIIRGSKKRIEIATAFTPDSAVEKIIELTCDIVSLHSLTVLRTREICDRRLMFRQTLIEELERLVASFPERSNEHSRINLLLTEQSKHNNLAANYYSPLIDNGLIRGPINHIRALSGFWRTPEILVESLGETHRWPITAFLNRNWFSQRIKQDWLEIAKLTFAEDECENWIAQVREALTKLI